MRALAGAVLLAATGLITPAAADVSDEILAKAIERYQAGELQPAIGGINAALRGRLSGSQVATAYYYRGLSQRKLGRPGEAITDLTRALDYGGLTDAQRSDAERVLKEAYQAAGISEQERVIVARTSREEDRSRQPIAVPPDASIVTSSIRAPETKPLQTAKGAAGVPATAWQPSAAAPLLRPSTWSSEQVSLAPLPPVPRLPRGSIAPPGHLPQSASKQSKREASSPALMPFVTEVSAPLAPGAAGVSLLVGDAGSRSEAFALVVRLTSQRGAELGPRRPQIAETKLADSGIYHVRLGPFADPVQAMSLCLSLRDSGYSCVTE